MIMDFMAFKKDFTGKITFNPDNYYGEFTFKGKIFMINLKGYKMDKSNR